MVAPCIGSQGTHKPDCMASGGLYLCLYTPSALSPLQWHAFSNVAVQNNVAMCDCVVLVS